MFIEQFDMYFLADQNLSIHHVSHLHKLCIVFANMFTVTWVSICLCCTYIFCCECQDLKTCKEQTLWKSVSYNHIYIYVCIFVFKVSHDFWEGARKFNGPWQGIKWVFVSSFLEGCGQIRCALAEEMVYKIGFVGGWGQISMRLWGVPTSVFCVTFFLLLAQKSWLSLFWVCFFFKQS